MHPGRVTPRWMRPACDCCDRLVFAVGSSVLDVTPAPHVEQIPRALVRQPSGGAAGTRSRSTAVVVTEPERARATADAPRPSDPVRSASRRPPAPELDAD